MHKVRGRKMVYLNNFDEKLSFMNAIVAKCTVCMEEFEDGET